MKHENRKKNKHLFFGNKDVSFKFSFAIISGLVILFFLASTFIYSQQKKSLGELMSAAQTIEKLTLKKQSETAKRAVRKDIEQLVYQLQNMVPNLMAEMDIDTLQQYADVISQDSKIEYVIFQSAEGNIFASSEMKVSEHSNDNIVNARVEVEDFYLGNVIVAYNFNDYEASLSEIKKVSAKNSKSIVKANNRALGITKKILIGTIVFVVLCIAAMTHALFKVLVTHRLSMLESRLKDIAEGEGDLTQRIVVNGDDSIDRVAIYFNNFLSTLHKMITQIHEAVEDLNKQTANMIEVTVRNKEDIELQKEEVNNTACAIEQMTASFHEVTTHASHALNTARQTDQDASTGNQVVVETIASINNLASVVTDATAVIDDVQADSEKIGAVLDVIRGIAEQTNLLALNAAIEAARAGEQGRGFAVVADEVRTLAQRTQESTQEIQQMIEQLQSGSNQAVSVMNQGQSHALTSVDIAKTSGESLVAITGSAKKIMEMNMLIAAASNEQSAVSDDINKKISVISAVSVKAGEAAQASLESSEYLSKISQNLKSLIGKFKI